MREKRSWEWVLWRQWRLRYRTQRHEGRGAVHAVLRVLLGAWR